LSALDFYVLNPQFFLQIFLKVGLLLYHTIGGLTNLYYILTCLCASMPQDSDYCYCNIKTQIQCLRMCPQPRVTEKSHLFHTNRRSVRHRKSNLSLTGLFPRPQDVKEGCPPQMLKITYNYKKKLCFLNPVPPGPS
jgi:hypothetical protein